MCDSSNSNSGGQKAGKKSFLKKGLSEHSAKKSKPKQKRPPAPEGSNPNYKPKKGANNNE